MNAKIIVILKHPKSMVQMVGLLEVGETNLSRVGLSTLSTTEKEKTT